MCDPEDIGAQTIFRLIHSDVSLSDVSNFRFEMGVEHRVMVVELV